MKQSRTELREKIMIILYQIYLYRKDNIRYIIEDVIKENYEVENKFLSDIVYGVLEKEDIIDETINKYMKEWNTSRLGLIDQAIIRLSTFELMFYDTPHIVSINEGIELSKKYSDEKVTKLINAVLDEILNNEVKDE
ncbi:MAG: transcription antitermination factor NusB [Bacilli bacterium]